MLHLSIPACILRAFAAAGSDGIARAVDGGRPLEIDGEMVLCGRSDDTKQRGFTGSLAELAIWNTALTAQQVSAIYTSVSSPVSSLHPRLHKVAWVCMYVQAWPVEL